MKLPTKLDLYLRGIQTCHEFLELNGISDPEYMTYETALGNCPDGFEGSLAARRFLRRVVAQDGRTQGSGTGLYYGQHVFVNLPRTAAPVLTPSHRSWSWPGWKTDRTACGVVAHEVGHHVDEVYVRKLKDLSLLVATWRAVWQEHRKPVSGYEPVASEAFAETMRLFILNPDLLRKAIPDRYEFCAVKLNLRPLPSLLRKGWRRVLGNENYFAAAERWAQR